MLIQKPAKWLHLHKERLSKMQLTIINSNSSGNAYLLENSKEALLIECGVRFDQIKKALNFNYSKVVACLVTHSHQDHCRSVREVMNAGIDVWASPGTHGEMKTEYSHRARVTFSGNTFNAGGFKIKAFDIKHDTAEPLGFLINHEETGNVLFLTDSYYCEYTFKGLNNIIIEANYSQDIVDNNVSEGSTIRMLRDRVIESHMSLQTCKKTLQANDLSAVNQIVLIHLSDGNSDAKRFKHEVEQQTGKRVSIAEAGMVLDFNRQPF
jgi:phosphoribosyl 1,2-cyclic phosphodiesterase